MNSLRFDAVQSLKFNTKLISTSDIMQSERVMSFARLALCFNNSIIIVLSDQAQVLILSFVFSSVAQLFIIFFMSVEVTLKRSECRADPY